MMIILVLYWKHTHNLHITSNTFFCVVCDCCSFSSASFCHHPNRSMPKYRILIAPSHSKKIRPRHKTVFCDIKYCIYRCLSLQLARILTATTSFPHMCKPKMCTTLLWFNSRIVSSAASHTTETHNMWSKRCLHANLRVLQPMYLSG